MIHREISDKKYQIDSLDGLRGFAALIVVFSHTSNFGMFFAPSLDFRGIGKSGVFLFFLLSSFLLTLPLLDKGRKVLSFSTMSHYFQRRFFRIYPLYTLYLLLGVISTWAISFTLGESGTGIPFSLDWQGFISHALLQETKGITWSIAVEFKFYFILPIFVLLIAFISSLGSLATILFFLIVLFSSQIISPQDQSLINDSRLLPYMPIFIIGMFLAVLQNYTDNRVRKTNRITSMYRRLGYVGVAGVIFMTPLVFSLFGERVPNAYFHNQFIWYAIFWSFILLSSINVEGPIRKFFSLPILRFYGAISFSLYLFHIVLIGAFSYLQINEYISAWLVLLASTGLAFISFKFIEEPISKYKVDRHLISSVSHLTKFLTREK